MKTTVMLLLTSDSELEDAVAEAVLEFGGVSHLTCDAGDALETICGVHDLDLVIIDFEHGPHGMTLLSRSTCYAKIFLLLWSLMMTKNTLKRWLTRTVPLPVFQSRFRLHNLWRRFTNSADRKWNGPLPNKRDRQCKQ